MGIFARELERALDVHKEDLPQMYRGAGPRNDPIWYPLRSLQIAPEIIDRLKAAAHSDDKRATLNPNDFELVCETLRFTDDEIKRLRTALLAQGVENFLRARMTPEEEKKSKVTVREITESIFNQLSANFQPLWDGTRGGNSDDFSPFVTGDDFEGVMRLLDHADSFKQAELRAKAYEVKEEQVFWQRVANTAYEAALDILTTDPSLAAVYADLLAEIRQKLNLSR